MWNLNRDLFQLNIIMIYEYFIFVFVFVLASRINLSYVSSKKKILIFYINKLQKYYCQIE